MEQSYPIESGRTVPDLRELDRKRVGMIFSDEDEDDATNSVLRWYYGTVTSVKLEGGGSCEAKICWEIGSTTTAERLSNNTWASADNTLGVGSWKLA